ncbi:MAG: UPF0182 family protein [Gammaproteobacteria bacterium]|nr:UPF0182 family protein [Gammaproteobacteria bacterium]
MLVSSHPTPQSRILFHRRIRKRVRHLAPCLNLDADPYIVLVDGRLYRMVDGYTTSSHVPYSEPLFSARRWARDDSSQASIE